MKFIADGSGDLVMRGPTSDDIDFAASYDVVKTVISSGSSTPATVDDIDFNDVTSAIIKSEAQLNVTGLTGGNFDHVSYESLNTGIGTVDSQGRVTRVGNGTLGVLVKTPWLTRRVDIPIGQAGGQTQRVFHQFTSGSVIRDSVDTLLAAVSGKSPSGTTRPIYTDINHTVKNASCWAAAYDFSGVSVNNTTGGIYRAGTVIHNRFVVFARHYPITNGSTLTFCDSGGTLVTRTLTSQTNISTSDITIGLLNSALPGTVKVYPVLPANYFDYMPGYTQGVPCVALDQEKKALIVEMREISGGTQMSVVSSRNTNLAPWYELPIAGDSGNPVFALLGGQLVLLTCWWHAFGGPFYTGFHDSICDEMDLLLDGASLTEVDLSSYDTY